MTIGAEIAKILHVSLSIDDSLSAWIGLLDGTRIWTLVNLLEIRKSQDLAKDLGGMASKAEKKICQSKIVSYIQKHNKTVVAKMKTK